MLPRHIGFIMDGNGRWAQARGLPRTEGYAAGLTALKSVLARLDKRGVKAVSVFAFSKENWARPDGEISAILNVIEQFNLSYDGRYRITYMGDIAELSESLAESVERVEAASAENTGLTLNIALNYSGRSDIMKAAEVAYNHGEFIEDTFQSRLSSAHLPPLDMIIRTGGEKRLSGFMLYEAAYAELLFLDKLWPDMNGDDADAVLEEFESRVRKFGALGAE